MATSITPPFAPDLAVLEVISIEYKPAWDGSAWVLTPADISVFGRGVLASSGVGDTSADVSVPFNSLPAAAQTALQQLYGFIEQELADQYT